MSLVLDSLLQQLDEPTIRQISSQLGLQNEEAQQAISAALPILLGALSRNTATEDGAQSLNTALAKDHHGEIFDGMPTAISQPEVQQDGAAILQHILGQKQRTVEEGISTASGVDTQKVAHLLMMLAPLVLGSLGELRDSRQLDAQGVSEVLQAERAEAEQDTALSQLMAFLDRDGDGSLTNEIIGLGSSLVQTFFNRRNSAGN